MKNKTFRSLALALVASTIMVSCEKTQPGNRIENGAELVGEVTEDVTLSKDNTYYLSGGYHILDGATLNIEEGVTVIAIDDDIVDYILVEQGGKINAQGTASNPIVMTSELEEAGAWGGIHICGKAPINVTGTTSLSEIGDATYGGNDSNDNSGTIKYVRLEYTGYSFSEEKEANGFTFYGVGNGTTIEYCQAYKGSDDGFEWFGGTVNVKYLVSTDNSDDSFDWTEGWTGKGQFLVAYQGEASVIGYDCDCLIEADNNSKNFELTPISCPTLSNLTLIGNGSTTAKRGVRLRAGTKAKIYNSLITGKPECLTTETTMTENSLVDGSSVLDFIYVTSGISCKEGVYSESLFTANSQNSINETLSFTDKYIGTINGAKDMATVDNFFVTTTYKGAVSPTDNWTEGWTK